MLSVMARNPNAASASVWRRATEAGRMETPGKSLLTSKTFYINLIGSLLQVLPGIAPHIPQPYGVIALAALNVLNRFFTSQPITGITVS